MEFQRKSCKYFLVLSMTISLVAIGCHCESVSEPRGNLTKSSSDEMKHTASSDEMPAGTSMNQKEHISSAEMSGSMISELPLPVIPRNSSASSVESLSVKHPQLGAAPLPHGHVPGLEASPVHPQPVSDESLHEHVERYQLHQAADDDSDELELGLNRKPVLTPNVGQSQKVDVKAHSVSVASDSIPIRVGPNTRLGANPSFTRNSASIAVRRPIPIVRKDQGQTHSDNNNDQLNQH